MLRKGLVQIYTGNGKGKTTAAFGLALRAAGRGNKVLIYQFLKHAALELGERIALKSCPLAIDIEAFPIEWNLQKSVNNPADRTLAAQAIEAACGEIAEKAASRQYDVIILDEIVFCVSQGLAKIEDVKKIIARRDPAVEIIMTGRGATKELIELADLVSEIQPVKHPYDKGIGAREGIEY